MAIPRRLIVDPQVTPWYHCISRCVRRTTIRGDLKRLMIQRMELLSKVFTIDTASYSLLDTHMHQLVRLDVKRMKNLTRTEVLQRWAIIHPPRGADRQPLDDIGPWVKEKLKDHRYVNNLRRRLCDLGWYMKELKEWSALEANRLYKEEGVFWSGRYRSIAILDEAALLATSVYVDLNPFAAGICSLPEEAVYSSLHVRWKARCEQQAMRAAIADSGSDFGERESWLCPIEDRRVVDGDGARVGLLDGLELDKYLAVVDETARKRREGKASLSEDTESILDRLGTNAEQWLRIFEQLDKRPELLGVYFAFRRQSLRDAATARGCHHVDNLNGCDTDVAPDLE